MPAIDSSTRYIRKYGTHLSIYLDKNTTNKSAGKPSTKDEIYIKGPLSLFERAMKESGAEVIHAHSSQAKGRVKRLFKTFQNLLVKEICLKG